MENIISIHFNLPSGLARKILKAEKKFGAAQYAGNYSYQPHITFYQAKFKKARLAELVRELASLSQTPFLVRISSVKSEVDKNNDVAFLYLALNKKKALYDLHEKMVKIANPLRGGLIRSKDLMKLKSGKYGAVEKENIKRYGSARVLSRFNPHITLGESEKMTSKLSRELRKNFSNIVGKSFLIDRLAIGLYRFDVAKNSYPSVCFEKEIIF